MERILFKLGLFLLIHFSWMSEARAAEPNRKPEKKPIQVALLIDKLDAFWVHFVRLTQDAAQQLGMQVTVFHGHESHIDMVRKAEQLLHAAKKPDVLMFKSFKGNGRQIMDLASTWRVKCFSINAPITLPPHPLPLSPFLIGELLPNDEDAGYQLARALRAEMKERHIPHIHLVAINGDQADTPAQLRERGLRRAVAEFKDITLHQLIADAWTAPHAAEQFEILRKRYPMINAVWGGNDTIARRIAEQGKASGYRLGHNLFVGGIDVTPEGLAAVKRGDLTVSVGGHIMDGVRALIILHDYFKRGSLPQRSWLTPMEAVTREEVDPWLQVLDPARKQPLDITRFARWQERTQTYDFTLPKP